MAEEQQQQPETTQDVAAGRNWSNGLCGCFGDIGLCIITYIAPCYTAGKNAEAVGENCFLHGFLAVVPIANIICGAKIRGLIREKHGIAGGFGGDCIMHWLCPFCAYVQEAREVTNVAVDVAMDRQ